MSRHGKGKDTAGPLRQLEVFKNFSVSLFIDSAYLLKKKQLIISPIFSIVCFGVYFTYFCSDLYYFFPSSDSGFTSFFF